MALFQEKNIFLRRQGKKLPDWINTMPGVIKKPWLPFSHNVGFCTKSVVTTRTRSQNPT